MWSTTRSNGQVFCNGCLWTIKGHHDPLVIAGWSSMHQFVQLCKILIFKCYTEVSVDNIHYICVPIADLQGKEVLFDTVFNESQYTWSWDTPKFLSKVTGGELAYNLHEINELAWKRNITYILYWQVVYIEMDCHAKPTICGMLWENWAKCLCVNCHPRLACAVRTGLSGTTISAFMEFFF